VLLDVLLPVLALLPESVRKLAILFETFCVGQQTFQHYMACQSFPKMLQSVFMMTSIEW